MSGLLLLVSAPSGAGKTSLVNNLLEQDSGVRVSISHTTRARRGNEEDGVNYHFVSRERFQIMVDDGAFLESAEVFGNYYGTSRDSVDTLMRQGKDVVLEIDWQGAAQIRRLHPDAVSIFILPPSRATLETRLRGRAQDNESSINTRLAKAISEMSHYGEFDYLIVNDDFETACRELHSIVCAERLRTVRRLDDLQPLLTGLLSEK